MKLSERIPSSLISIFLIGFVLISYLKIRVLNRNSVMLSVRDRFRGSFNTISEVDDNRKLSSAYYATVIRLELNKDDRISTELSADELEVLLSAFITVCNLDIYKDDMSVMSSNDLISPTNLFNKFQVDVTVHVIFTNRYTLYPSLESLQHNCASISSPWIEGNDAYQLQCAMSPASASACRSATVISMSLNDINFNSFDLPSNFTMSPVSSSSSSSSSTFQLWIILGIIAMAVIVGPLLAYIISKHINFDN